MGFTPTTGQVRGASLPAPDPGGPSFSLLSVSQTFPFVQGMARAVDTLPLDPVRLDHARCVQSQQLPHCPPEPHDPMDLQGEDPGETFRPVAWGVPVGCSNTPANAAVFQHWADLAKQDVEAATAQTVEKYLWSDADNIAIQGNATSPTLMSTAVDVTSGGDPVNPRDGVAQLLQARADCQDAGGGATLHIPPVLAPYLLDHRTIEKAGSRLVGPTGELVAVGGGYQSRLGPFDSGTNPEDGIQDLGIVWIALSGPIYLYAGEAFDAANPARLANTFIEGHVTPRTNAAQIFFERRAIFAFDTCCVKAIRVTVPNVTGYAG